MIKLLVHNDKGEYELLDTHETEVDEVFLIRGEHFNHAETDRHAYHFDKKFDYAELVELGVYCYNPVRGWYRLEDAVPKEPEGSIVIRRDTLFVIAYSSEEAHRYWEARELSVFYKHPKLGWKNLGSSAEPEGTVKISQSAVVYVSAYTPEHAQLIWENL